MHIFSVLESFCTSYRPWHDKEFGKTTLEYDSGKCPALLLLIDEKYGFCYLRVPTWAPFRLQFYMNGHNLLATKLSSQGIVYDRLENAFLYVDDWEKTQKFSDHLRIHDLHEILDIFARRIVPSSNNTR